MAVDEQRTTSRYRGGVVTFMNNGWERPSPRGHLTVSLGRRMSVMVHTSSAAVSEARHPTSWWSALWAPAGVSGMSRGTAWQRTYHILLRRPRLSWGTVASALCWYCTNGHCGARAGHSLHTGSLDRLFTLRHLSWNRFSHQLWWRWVL